MRWRPASSRPTKHQFGGSILFYANVEPRNPTALMEATARELKPLEKFLLQSRDRLRVDNYGIGWELDEGRRYRLAATARIEIPFERTKILLKVDPSEYREGKVVLHDTEEPLKANTLSTAPHGVLIELADGEHVQAGEHLYYGVKRVMWELQPQVFSDQTRQLSNGRGSIYKVLGSHPVPGGFMVDLDKPLPHEVSLYSERGKVDFKEIPWKLRVSAGLRDQDGPVRWSLSSGTDSVIEVNRQLRGPLADDGGRVLYYDEIPRSHTQSGEWVILREPEEEDVTPDGDQRTKLDTFFELLSASPPPPFPRGAESEVWEHSDLPTSPKQRGGKIAVLRANREEGRLLLERLPTTDVVYPPKNTYQVRKQLEAVQGLLFYPAPAHRGLLRLFEDTDIARWPSPPTEFRDATVQWEILEKPEKRSELEGTDIERAFVVKALNTPDFAILEGPPGSGKTTAITEVVLQLLRAGKRVMLSASTHVAVDNVLEKLEGHFAGRGGLLKNGIVPLRMGRESTVREAVQRFRFDNRADQLRGLWSGLEWFRALSQEQREDYVNDFLVHSSNLVCGTILGILQYPGFRRTDKHTINYADPEFDYLIIDEASKTTFLDFLVPARRCKKWILVGDPKQLSPYTDLLQARVNIDATVEDVNSKAAWTAYLKLVFEGVSARRREGEPHPPPILFVAEPVTVDALARRIAQQSEYELERSTRAGSEVAETRFCVVREMRPTADAPPNMIFLGESDLHDPESVCKMSFSDMIVVERRVFLRQWELIPPRHLRIDIVDSGVPVSYDFRHLDWVKEMQHTAGHPPYGYRVDRDWIDSPTEVQEHILTALRRNWAGEVAWRLKRVYELREANSGAESYYHASLMALLPQRGQPDHSRVQGLVKDIGRIALPSVLTSLQQGTGDELRPEDRKTAITDGLPAHVLDKRHEILRYQHRMHPEISAFPRQTFYGGSDALRDSTHVRNDGREWPGRSTPFLAVSQRAWWVDVRGKAWHNSNREEAEKALSLVNQFTDWAMRHPKKENGGDAVWTVIILSFYERQRRLIRDMLRSRSPENSRKDTQFQLDGVKVQNYTVDKVQGQEGDVVILSMVQTRRVGFMDSPNRLNVALTRARYQLFVIGDRKYFHNQKNSSHLRQLATIAGTDLERGRRGDNR